MNQIQVAIDCFDGNASRLARAVGVTAQTVFFWRDGMRSVPVKKCATIERVTNSKVTRQKLRPDDWAEIWPELAPAHIETAQPAIETIAPIVANLNLDHSDQERRGDGRRGAERRDEVVLGGA